ncbi:hypothetical protein [Aeromonas salmonicida]|uniref:GAP1-N1 domain-containing protein n=1 Tax=Aeromonas salmonicida TaxID=645 RepID=UPI0024A9337F|nr:hypothetical protein [Aeromonas salmonicida]MDM5134687.1 hypothetical protein [Aeromonas salmonicida]WHF42190.1 hypothetical protein QJ050_05270 [Aeromonas salmonicida]
MTTIDIQIHGYHKGHQLLASSISLLKEDQAVIDRLSDIAGPLRPREQFPPYLSAYPLPSGSYYVVAKTWQDLSVPRAGCVKTKSLLIDAQYWSENDLIIPILRLLGSNELPKINDTMRIELEEQYGDAFSLPIVPIFNASELLEALFLEDSKPVVVFDAPDSELIALRLLTALWPGIRRRFALSTFALSPRKIGGRDLDLVFAPSNSKARFSDWSGRRVDARLSKVERHKWTRTIVRRVFEDPLPSLLTNRDITLLGRHEEDSTSVLRIALLWDELFGNLAQRPTAILGLLDITNSGMVNSTEAAKLLEPHLVDTIYKVESSLLPNDAWDFVGTITQKLQDHEMPASKKAVEHLVTHLAERAPNGILGLLKQQDSNDVIDCLIPSIAIGLGNGVVSQVKQVLVQVPMDIIARLISQGGALISQVVEDDELIEKIGIALCEVDQDLADRTGMTLLPFLIEDRQLPAALPVFSKLDAQGVVAELRWLGDVNGFQAKELSAKLIERAREIDGLPAVREVLISSEMERADVLLALTIEPVRADMLWLLDEDRLSEASSSALIAEVLRGADGRQFEALLSDRTLGNRMVARLSNDAVDILTRVALQESLPINEHICLVQTVLPKLDDDRKFEIAGRVLGRCLRNRFDGDELAVLSMLLDILGAKIDGRWAVWEGLERNNDAGVASRNLVAFEKAPSAARERIVGVVDDIASTLQRRLIIDLTEAAYDACAWLILDAEKKMPRSMLVDAASLLIPSLLRAHSQPVSFLIAALFPIAYQELAKSNDIPELKTLFFFFDWDRCKTARSELVRAFMLSSWNPGNLAITAYRCGDMAKIFKQVARSYGGEKYLIRIKNDLSHLADDDRNQVMNLITEILA